MSLMDGVLFWLPCAKISRSEPVEKEKAASFRAARVRLRIAVHCRGMPRRRKPTTESKAADETIIEELRLLNEKADLNTRMLALILERVRHVELLALIASYT